MQSVQDRLLAELAAKKINPAQLVRMTSLGRATIDRFFLKSHTPEAMTLFAIARALGYEYDPVSETLSVLKDKPETPLTIAAKLEMMGRQMIDFANQLRAAPTQMRIAAMNHPDKRK